MDPQPHQPTVDEAVYVAPFDVTGWIAGIGLRTVHIEFVDLPSLTVPRTTLQTDQFELRDREFQHPNW
jgi:hypothetical protein